MRRMSRKRQQRAYRGNVQICRPEHNVAVGLLRLRVRDKATGYTYTCHKTAMTTGYVEVFYESARHQHGPCLPV